MPTGVVSEQNKLFRNWGAYVDIVFLTRVKEGDFCEEKMADLEETKRCTVLESADGSSSDGPGEYAMKMLIC